MRCADVSLQQTRSGFRMFSGTACQGLLSAPYREAPLASFQPGGGREAVPGLHLPGGKSEDSSRCRSSTCASDGFAKSGAPAARVHVMSCLCAHGDVSSAGPLQPASMRCPVPVPMGTCLEWGTCRAHTLSAPGSLTVLPPACIRSGEVLTWQRRRKSCGHQGLGSQRCISHSQRVCLGPRGLLPFLSSVPLSHDLFLPRENTDRR